MKKFLLVMLIPLFFSCIKEDEQSRASFDDIKYFTINSYKPGTLIKKELISKRVVLLAYPEYAAQSYNLIKFITAIMNREKDLTITLLGHPEISENELLIDHLRREIPLLGFSEYIDLNSYLNSLEITITGTIMPTSGKLLILAPAKNYIKTKDELLKIFKDDKIVKVAVAGSDLTKNQHHIISELPELKKISSVPLVNNKFDILILMGEIENYKPVTPIELYSEENYLDAPKSFVEENRSLIKSVHVKRMNNYLPKRINKSFKN